MVLIVTIALLDSTRAFRLSRIVAQGVNVLEYAETARLHGEGLGWLILRHGLYSMVERGVLAEPVIGVALEAWDDTSWRNALMTASRRLSARSTKRSSTNLPAGCAMSAATTAIPGPSPD